MSFIQNNEKLKERNNSYNPSLGTLNHKIIDNQNIDLTHDFEYMVKKRKTAFSKNMSTTNTSK